LLSEETVLELCDATIVKNGTPILDRVTLTIRSGEHTAIVGPNGAGKSVLIKLLIHQEYPFAADSDIPAVRVFGSDRWNVFELRSRLGIVSADLHHRFVSGNSAGQIRGDAVVLSGIFATQGFLKPEAITDELRQRAAAALARMEASHLAGKMMDEMSTGEARRVLIARALVTNPRALVLDEPTTGLDVVARHRFLELIRKIAAAGTTLILVTHHVEEIIQEVEKVVFLQRGRVSRTGSKRTMLTDECLSELFGAPIRVTESGGRYHLTT
jgi:iron complex transport system ATP-binding protein